MAVSRGRHKLGRAADHRCSWRSARNRLIAFFESPSSNWQATAQIWLPLRSSPIRARDGLASVGRSEWHNY